MKNLTVLDAVTATVAAADAAKVDISNATAITLQFTRANHAAGSSAFVVQVSNDGSNWVTYNKLIKNQVNANSEMLLRAAAPTLSSDTSEVWSFSPEDSYQKMRVYVTETTDGTHSCTVHIRE
jgi:hypothetical protein